MLRHLFALVCALACGAVAAAAPCEGLVGASLEGATVTASVAVPGPVYLAADGQAYDRVPPLQFPKYVGGDPNSAASFACADNGNTGVLNPVPAAEYLR